MRTYRLRSICTLLAAALVAGAVGQINIQDRLERKIKERADRKVDQGLDKGLDKVEEGVNEGAKDATKKKGKEEGAKPASGADGGSTGSSGDSGPSSGKAGPATLKSYSRFDFIPGEQVVAVEDFMQDAIGDFPAKWNTNASGEVVTIDGRQGRWLKLSGDGIFYPEFVGEIPDNATVELDLAVLGEYSYYCGCVTLRFVQDSKNLLRPGQENLLAVGIHPQNAGGREGSTFVEVRAADGSEIMRNERGQAQLVHRGVAPIAHVALWRQKNRMRLYLNEEKVWDIPRAFQSGAKYRLVIESGACGESVPYIANLRVAQGAPDTRSKLITEGKLVTRGILFDSGSDRIKPESYGTLKDIAAVLQENAAVRVRIIGHTDSDGDDASNQELSKRRAAAVKDALAKEFGIDGGRMETDGKGESQPAGPNDTPQGRANNRRVEFVKL
jgi:outer membrane protein OmpA-like peptidoglycan-associated protein